MGGLGISTTLCAWGNIDRRDELELRKRMRDSGVPELGRISWGTHVCVFYDSVSEMFEIIIPYFHSGLENNEKCIWICSRSSRKQEAEGVLRAALPDADKHVASGQMTVLSHDEFYVDKEGGFCPERVVSQWKTLMDQAIAEGYEGLRVSGDTSWVDRKIWDSFSSYERSLYGSIDHERMLVACCYPRRDDWMPRTIDVLSSHQYALIRKGYGWEVMRCGLRREERWEALFDETSEGVLVTDETGMILAANRAAFNYFGVNVLADLGENIGELSRRFSLRSERGEEILTIRSVLAGQGPRGPKHRFSARTKDGRPLDLLVHAREVEETSVSTRRFLVLLEDLTAILSFERTKERAVRILAHELRNPLQVLKAAVRLLEDSQSGTSARRYVATLTKQVDSLSYLIEDLLLAFRTDAAWLAITPRSTDLTRLVVECVEGIRALCDQEIVTLYKPDQSVPVYGDEIRLRQILTNLLRNAATYTPPGKRIWVDVRSLGGRVLVRVEDEGIGIPEGETDLIFNAFFRGSNASQASTEGMGLGLYISRQLARLHGGDLWAERRPGGTVMTLSLPLYAGEHSGFRYDRESAGGGHSLTDGGGMDE